MLGVAAREQSAKLGLIWNKMMIPMKALLIMMMMMMIKSKHLRMSKEQSVFLTNSDLQLQGAHGLSELYFHLALDVEKMGDIDKIVKISKESRIETLGTTDQGRCWYLINYIP